MLRNTEIRRKAARELCHELNHAGIYWNESLLAARGFEQNPDILWCALVDERVLKNRLLELLEIVQTWLEMAEDGRDLDPGIKEKIADLIDESRNVA